MIHVRCSCGGEVEIPNDSPADTVECPHCQRPVRIISTIGATDSSDWSVLVIAEGPDRVGEQLFLRGNGPVPIGSASDNLIVLTGDEVAQHHCQLVRAGDQWRIEDLSDSRSLRINDAPAEAHDLSRGDVIGIGPFELEYTGTVPTVREKQMSAPAAAEALSQSFSEPRPSQLAGVVCPACGQSLPMDARICVDCGIDLRTGRPLLTSRGVDENELYARTETAVRALSWILPFGIYPVASEAFGTRKPFVIWIIAFLTVFSTIIFWKDHLDAEGRVIKGQNLMLWVGHPPAIESDPDAAMPSIPGEFHIWQLVTYALLHNGILPLAENLLFLHVLGSRVNALLGQIRTAILYPLLAALAGLLYLLMQSHRALHPVVGASGAIMGLAGVYLVLFPAHRVHTVAWVRTGISGGFQLAHNVFAVPGFTVVFLYFLIDALLTLLRESTHPSAWLHFAGFPIGVLLGLALLLSRQAHARGGDILSLTLGRHAWLLIGKPNRQTR